MDDINNIVDPHIHCDTTVVGYSRPLVSADNTTNDHTVVCLYGPQIIDVIMRKPEFSFLIKQYYLLYQSLIPNCKLTIKLLKQHIEITSDVERFIVNGESSRIRCQRIINLLLVQLDTTRNYKHFCCLLNMVTVMTYLPDKLMAGTMCSTRPVKYGAFEQFDTQAADNIIIRCVHDGAPDDRATISSHHQVIGRRCRPANTVPDMCYLRLFRSSHTIKPHVDPFSLVTASEWTILDDYFSLLCNCLPDDYQSTLIKLKSLPHLSNDDHRQLDSMISSSHEVQLVNEKIVTFLIVKLCYNGSSSDLVGLCDVMDNLIVSKQSASCVQQVRYALTQQCFLSSSSSTTNTDNSSPPRPSGGSVTSVTYTQHHISTSSSTTNTTPLLSSVTVTTSLTSNSITMNSRVGQDTCTPITDPRLLRSKYDDIVQSLPSNYEKTLQVVQDHLTDDQICDVLATPNYTIANKTILNCLMEKVKCEGDVLEFCNQLENISSLLPDHGSLFSIISELRTANPSQPPDGLEENLPQKIIVSKDFVKLKTHYHTILQLMPDNYERSVGKLQNYISDDQICMILSSSNSTTANKIILDCLIERMSCREELLDLCDQLETISTSHQLMKVISEIRSGIVQSFQYPFSTTSTGTIQPLLPGYLQDDPNENSLFYQFTFSKILLDPNSRVLDILKKNYVKLCECLPQDYMKTIDKMKQLQGVPYDDLQSLRKAMTPRIANEGILCVLIRQIKSDIDILKFCDCMNQLVDNTASGQSISTLRNEFLKAIGLPLMTTNESSLPGDGTSSLFGLHQPKVIIQIPQHSSVSTLSHAQARQGIKCPPPPPLPPNYIPRQQLLDEIVTKLCHSTNDPNSYVTSLTVTGAGGFGKTSIVIALCHHPVIKEQFTDGFVFIQLGPQATDPSMKLSQLYHLLTGQYLKQGDINHTEQEINQLTSLHCRNLLVVIDDLWHVEDAEPIVKAFCNCKIVLTTRMNDVDQYIPTKQVVSVGPLEPSEARSLLTYEVIDISQLSQEDVNLLDQLAKDVHLWPLLLSLVRGQLSHNVKCCHSSHQEAIHYAQAKLCNKGLTAFDKNNIERSRKYAVKVCIDMTLELLTETLSDKIKSLILWTGIGTSVQKAVLHHLWNIGEYEAKEVIDTMWAYGLIQFTMVYISPCNSTQHCVEVHAVISQFILENMNYIQVYKLSPFSVLDTWESVMEEISVLFKKSYGVQDLASLSPAEFLQYRLCEIECDLFPHYLKQINMITLLDSYSTIMPLEHTQNTLIAASPNMTAFVPSLTEQINTLISECHKIIKNVHKLSRTLNQKIQNYFAQRDYSNLVQCVENYMSGYPVGLVAKQAVFMVKKIMPYCDGELQNFITHQCEILQMKTPDYHYITLIIVPNIKLLIKELLQINSSLHSGSPSVEVTYRYYADAQYDDDLEMIKMNYLIKCQEVAPKFVAK
ncbi:uncharacterized protein [Dysidea avara]|uniref:uncharacterized protein isoform X2 n=1 Tax=Dysidea avara TaxID=196820 RepID=UPI00332941C0